MPLENIIDFLNQIHGGKPDPESGELFFTNLYKPKVHVY